MQLRDFHTRLTSGARKLAWSLALFTVLAGGASADLSRVVGRGADQFGGYTTDYILVRFKSGQVPAQLKLGVARTGAPNVDRLSMKWGVSKIDTIQPGGYGDPQLAERLGLSRTYMFRVPNGTDVGLMSAQYNALPNVEFAEVDGIGGVAYTPNDPSIGQCWGMNNTGQTGGTPDADIDAFEGWDIWRGSDNTTVAVVDTGVDGTHPEFAGRMVPGFNTNNNTNDTTDQYGHGTHVAGTVGANGDNNIGVAGVNFGTKIMPMRVLNASGSGTEAQCGAGIVWAADNGANICTMSLQYYTGTTTFRDNVDYAYNKGVLLIAANGNSQGNIIAYPAKFARCQGVGATTHTDSIAGFSNYGPECDISAPGENVYSTYPGNQYRSMSGTSMATPHTSGLASLLWSYDRGLTNDEVFKLITTTADDKGATGWDQYFGWGRINAFKALTAESLPLIGFTSMNVTHGTLQSGVVGDLFNSDNSAVKIGSKVYPLATDPNARLVAEGVAPNMPFNRVQILLEASVNTPGVIQVVEAWDFVAGSWITLDQRSAATKPDVYTVVNITSNPSRFLDGGTNSLRARVSFLDRGTALATWTASIDQFRGALRNN